MRLVAEPLMMFSLSNILFLYSNIYHIYHIYFLTYLIIILIYLCCIRPCFRTAAAVYIWDRQGWMGTLGLRHPIVPFVEYLMSSISTTVNSAIIILFVTVIIYVYVSRLAALSMTSASVPLVVPPGLYQLGVPISAVAAVSLPHVISYLITRPAVAK